MTIYTKTIHGVLHAYRGVVMAGDNNRHGPFVYFDKAGLITTYGHYYKSRYHGFIWRNGSWLLYVNGRDCTHMLTSTNDICEADEVYIRLTYGSTISEIGAKPNLKKMCNQLKLYVEYMQQPK